MPSIRTWQRCWGRETARRLKVLPLFKVRGQITLATAQPQAVPSLREAEEALGCRVRAVLVRQEEILAIINEAGTLGQVAEDLIVDVGDDFEVLESGIPDDYDTIDEMASGSPVINLVNSLIHRAVRDGASDIHIEPFRHVSRVRFRIDGILYEVMTPAHRAAPGDCVAPQGDGQSGYRGAPPAPGRPRPGPHPGPRG